MVQTYPGEHLVGAYLRLIEECELVSYNQRSSESGHQMELDVLGVRSDGSEQTIFACEVTTHLDGIVYSGTPSTDRWSDYGNQGYQYTLERIEEKFTRDQEYVADIFDEADEYALQLWSPYINRGLLTDGLEELSRAFSSTHDATIDLVINEAYTARIDELRELAQRTTKDYGEPGFRYVQILENLR